MNQQDLKDIHRSLLECAEHLDTRKALQDWFDRHIEEFGNVTAARRDDRELDDPQYLRHVREQSYFEIAKMLCNAEAGVESLEPTAQGSERKTRLFVLAVRTQRSIAGGEVVAQEPKVEP